MDFFTNYNLLCKAAGKSANGVAKELGIASGSVTQWKQGSTPRPATVERIAKYFGVTPEELLFGIKKEPSIPTDEELDKNDAMWSAYNGVLEDAKELPLHEANLIFKMLGNGGQGMNFNELYAFTSVLSKLAPDERLRLFQLADKIRQDKSEP